MLSVQRSATQTTEFVRGAVVGLLAVSAFAVPAARAADLVDTSHSVVSCEYLDDHSLALRTSTGLLLEAGLVVRYSSLLGVTTVDAQTRDGQTLTARRVIAIHPEADIALLELPERTPHMLPNPEIVAAPVGTDITLLRGPNGAGPNSKPAEVYGKFSIGGPDFVAISEGHGDCAAAFLANGALVGISFDLSEQGFPLAYLVSTASIANLVESRGEPVELASMTPPTPPDYESRNDATGLAFRAAILLTEGRTDDARRFAELALKKDATNAAAHFWMGRVQFGDQRYDQAAASFQRAGQLAPEYHLAWHMAGAAFNQAGNYTMAMEMYRKALRAEPCSALTWCNLGGAEFNKRNFAEAESAFSKAIECDPTYGLAYFNLAVLQKQTGRPDDAERTYEMLVAKDPGWSERLRLALDAR
ncbi:MAG: tetratricopeptide repeat protein [Candidatus Eisenbacteria bacterium]|uniref:Tetratricopeptide repeat protein n=1 Tax=Eiseniibacteriota bacterium TaxID=2212470 RepID=A0A956NFS9_UNCEI|nr:tetratricopeptide repeat protein [Candidatus Eisenbacteria bacterium]MCB9463307.1 tetratricopeptide repeat protein [Candidatus Eisenbacteria bacterium]